MQIEPSQIVLAGLCLAGAWTDLRYRRLSNLLCVVALAGGLGFAFADGGLGAVGSHLLHALIALVVGMGLFAARIVGGGDAKFYAGIAAWFALADGARLLLAVSLGGLVLFLVWFVYRRLSRKPISRRDGAAEGKFPYGVAIAAGAVIASGSALI